LLYGCIKEYVRCVSPPLDIDAAEKLDAIQKRIRRSLIGWARVQFKDWLKAIFQTQAGLANAMKIQPAHFFHRKTIVKIPYLVYKVKHVPYVLFRRVRLGLTRRNTFNLL